MRTIILITLTAVFSLTALAQNETAPLVENELKYENWHYKNVFGDGKTKLRDFAEGKKLVLVVYFAAWCHNWRHEAPLIQQLHEKYKDRGLGIIGVAEYDSVEKTRKNLNDLFVTIPAVYESESLSDRTNTKMYAYRTSVGDTRKWGSPFHVFFETSQMTEKGDVVVTRAFTVSGEVEDEKVEAFIRERLGLPRENPSTPK